jgi:hypothetical protein
MSAANRATWAGQGADMEPDDDETQEMLLEQMMAGGGSSGMSSLFESGPRLAHADFFNSELHTEREARMDWPSLVLTCTHTSLSVGAAFPDDFDDDELN